MYISRRDLDYIRNKHHNLEKPYFGNKHAGGTRFVCNPEIFDPSTGIDPELMVEGLKKNDLKYEKLSHKIRKARAFEYVLENTRIACDSRDRFPAICQLDRPISKALQAPWRRELFDGIIPEVEKKRARLEAEGVVTIWVDFDHSVPVWDKIFKLGFTGILSDVLEKRECFFKSNPKTEDSEAFFEGVVITYRALVSFVGRLAALAEKTDGSSRLAEALRRLCNGAPTCFYDVLLAIHI